MMRLATFWRSIHHDSRMQGIFFLTALVIVFDQLTKFLVVSTMPLYSAKTVIPGFFNVVHIQNRGAAFGFLNRSDTDWQFWIFAGATLLAIGMIVSLARGAHARDFWQLTGLGHILGGALGNFVDRVRMRAVTDFLDFYVGDWHWPAFNIADMAICIGAFFVCVSLFRARSYTIS